MTNVEHEKRYFTAREAADYLGVHINTVYSYIYSGHLKSVKIGRKWVVTAKELERALTEGIDLDQ